MSALSDLQKKLEKESQGIMFPFSANANTVSTTQNVYNSATDGIMTMQGQKYVGPDAVIQYGTEEQDYQRQLKQIEAPMLPQFDADQFPKAGEGIMQTPTPASTSTAPIAAMEHNELPIYAIQFHPEVTHTEYGKDILDNFIFKICHSSTDWKMDDLISQRVDEIKNKVKKDKVLLGLSGGVDSSVTAALLHKAIGKKLTCVFVDNGLLRKGEADEVMQTFKDNMSLNVIKSDSQDVFLRHLKNIDDPEQKRKVIGRTFIDVFDAEAIKLKDVKFLAQGTIYPDVIESSGSESKEARVIKSHHNVGGLPEEMELDLVEPLKDLFKDEVRRMGIELGIPKEMLERHPFPGPGLGVRIIGEITKEKTKILQEADSIFIEELIKENLYDTVSQAFAVLLPVKSVGVVGDERRYAEVIALRAVETVDFMTARWAHLPYKFLEHVSNRIVNEIEEVSRVVYDISSKPPATIEWE